MESLLAKALEFKLKYWLKSYTRDQFKLRGRSVQLFNLDLNGEVLHASIGLPPTLLVSQARVGILEIKVPAFSNVQTEPVVVEIDKLDLVLVEQSGIETDRAPEPPGPSSPVRSTSYGFADKIADGMTIQVGLVNLLLETRGGSVQAGASWIPPLAAITIRNLLLYTTNEAWQTVNLKEARDFSTDKRCIYVFKKLEWDSLSVDLLPHPDMFNDVHLTTTTVKTDNDGLKRLFFGGERFLDDISGKAFITMHRTEQNNPLGLEVQVCISEATCSSLSEPGLRALLRFMTGMYVCMNRKDVSPQPTQSGAEAAGCSMVKVAVEHIFICIKDADFKLELSLQQLHYMRASVTNGESTKTLAQFSMGSLFLRDTFSEPVCDLLQPGRQSETHEPLPVPHFANEKLWPRIHPGQNSSSNNALVPMLCMYSVQVAPSPAPPVLASQTVVQCQPLKLVIQEESCLRLASFLVDGVVVDHGVVSPTTSIDSLYFSLQQLDLVIPFEGTDRNEEILHGLSSLKFTGARLHLDNFVFVQSPSLSLKGLSLEKDAACFMLWQGQPVDASQRRWVMRAMHLSVALEMGTVDSADCHCDVDWSFGLWRCIEITEPCIEAAMVTGDGEPILDVPPPGGIVRFGVHCKCLTSNTSVEQLFFVLRMYEHLGQVHDSLSRITKTSRRPAAQHLSSMRNLGSFKGILEVAPSDTAVCLGLEFLELKFLESLSEKEDLQGPPLAQIYGNVIELTVTHRTLGGAIAIASNVIWKDVLVECVETTCKRPASSIEICSEDIIGSQNVLRPVVWIQDGKYEADCSSSSQLLASSSGPRFLDINVSNMIPYQSEDAGCHSLRVKALISGIRLGGGIAYSEALLHRFGVLGPDGEPGRGLKRVLKNLSSGPFARLFASTPQITSGGGCENGEAAWELGIPNSIEFSICLKDWILALEADLEGVGDAQLRTERCWHAAFRCLSIGAREVQDGNRISGIVHHPVKRIVMGIEGLEFIKPITSDTARTEHHQGENKAPSEEQGKGKREEAIHNGLDIEVVFGLREEQEDSDMHIGQWSIKRVKSGIRKAVEIEAVKEDIDYLVEIVSLEIASAGRVAAGIMHLLELQGSIGEATIKQLSTIGSGGLDRLTTPEKMGRRSSIGSVGSVPTIGSNLKEKSNLNITISKLEQLVTKSQKDCADLNDKLAATKCLVSNEGFCPLSTLTEQLKEMEELISMVKSHF